MFSTSYSPARALGRIGLWRGGDLLTTETAIAAEHLGYHAVWIGRSPAADLEVAERLLNATERITVATGIVNIWTSPATEVAASFHRLDRSHPGRLILGIGIGHREVTGDRYRKPYDALVTYLDALDAEGVPIERRVIAALGPRTLQLSADRAAGTHPYLTTPGHTRFARGVVGPGVLVAPEQRLIAATDEAAARATARSFLSRYLSLSNYRRTLENHGFTAADLDDGATDEAVDRLVPHGAPPRLAAAVRAQLESGADHVCVQFLPAREDPRAALEALASELDLR